MVQGVEAQTGKVYTTDMGLSSSLINQIFQDQQGFVWVATEYGLNKFDGLRFTNYRPVVGKLVSGQRRLSVSVANRNTQQ